jgi:hypothetical protein
MLDRIVAIAALLTLGIFLGILAVRVPHPDLIIVLAVCFLLAAIDLITSTWRRRRRNGNDASR